MGTSKKNRVEIFMIYTPLHPSQACLTTKAGGEVSIFIY
jgi:hypothetical protein